MAQGSVLDRRRFRTSARLVTTGLAVVLLAGCIGATSRADFDEEIRGRGGGLSAAFVTDALDVVAAEVGATSWQELRVLSLRAQPGNRAVTVVVRRVDRPEFVDTVTVRDGELLASVPLQDADELPLDDLVIPLDSVALDRMAEIRAEALAVFADEYGDDDGFVESVTLTRAGSDVALSVDVESARRTATVVFTADGSLREIG